MKTKMIKSTSTKQKNPWQVHLSKVYKDMKIKDKSTKLGDAMKAAKKTYRRK